ncbi:MAG: 4Fe-4S dicluster domain-containing protein [Gemmatimonadetes bacterium]|nr:4Fe-4S dicluster domain-containing protein [Gemmatimonadota bacterium]
MSHPASTLSEGPDAAGEPGSQHVSLLDLPTSVGAPSRGLAATLASEQDKLLTCIHCGFCLPACPTYTRLGDENDSPRGRLYLMRAVAEGRLDPAADAFQLHIDRCLGCRACETVCPAGVQYGALFELAREEAVKAGGSRWSTRLLLAVFASPRATRLVMALGRTLRDFGLATLIVRLLPGWRWLAGIRLAAGMLAASAPWRGLRRAPEQAPPSKGPDPADGAPGGTWADAPLRDGAALAAARGGDSSRPIGSDASSAAVLLGCVQRGLFGRVNDATRRVLGANGLGVVDAPGQGCCGALHAHGGNLEGARALARRNVDAFEAAGADVVVVNAAGCAAIMKEYGHLLEHDPVYAERAAHLAASVRDLAEVLAERGPRPGAPVGLRVTADAPCHQLHAQGLAAAPAAMLAAVPGLAVLPLRAADECCGGAGMYGITHTDLGGRIGADKVAAVVETGAQVVITGNPGCAMQIGAGLRRGRVRCGAIQPVELLDESYRRAGLYQSSR